MRVLITGAGVAGLSCALALRRSGAKDVVIVERGSEVAAQGGTGIAIPPNGTRALGAVGLPVDRLIERGSRLTRYRILNRGGRELTCADLTRLWLSPSEPYFAVHRRRIYEALLEELGDQPIEFGTTAEVQADSFSTDGPVSVKIAAPKGSRVEMFDLVIGADGIRSALRRALWPAVKPRPLGWWTWRSVIEYDGAEPETQVVMSGRGGVLTWIPIGEGQVYLYASIRQQDDAATREERGHGANLVARLADFSVPRPIYDAVAALPDRAFHVGPLEEVPHEQLSGAGRGRAVLVGDALHACSPNMAQGVSLAAEDAAVLADVVRLSSRDGVPERFWQRRLPRIRHVQECTRKRDHLLNKRADSGLFQKVSNVVIRLRGGDRLQREAFAYLLENRA